MDDVTMHGTFCYPGGRKIEVMSPHPEWTAWAVRKLDEAAERERVEPEWMRTTKPAWVWVYGLHPYTIGYPGINGDLFFSSPAKFRELLGRDPDEYETLVKVRVPLDFDNWDYIPENY